MKKNYPKLIIVLIAILAMAYAITNTKASIIVNYHHILFWIITFLFLKRMVGLNKDKYIYRKDMIQIVFIYSALFLILTNLLGLLTGFLKNSYNLSFFKVIENITPVLILIIFQELVRNIIASKAPNKIMLYLLTFVFIISDIMLGFNSYPHEQIMEIFELIVLLIIPAIFNNLLLTYISYKSGYKPAILYRIIFELPLYFLPIFPNLGAYLQGVLYIIFITLLFLKIHTFFSRRKSTSIRKKSVNTIFFWVPALSSLILIAILISGLFQIYVMAVASQSMDPSISKGDIIVIERASRDDISGLDIGDVIAYEYDNRIIVHRIINVYGSNKKLIFQTKGDNNQDPDAYYTEENKIRGLVKLKIKYLGYPSVWFSELIN